MPERDEQPRNCQVTTDRLSVRYFLLMISRYNSPGRTNREPLGAKTSNSQNNAANGGEQQWQIINHLREIGGSRQREETKTFASEDEAKRMFDKQVERFRKMFKQSAHATISQSETELLVHIDGIQIVKMTYQAVLPLCA